MGVTVNMRAVLLAISSVCIVLCRSALPPSPDAFILPLEKEMKHAFDTDKLTKWSEKPNYRADFSVRLHPANETWKAVTTVVDEDFDGCDEVRPGYVACRECFPCEVEAAMYDSCGFMTGRTCVPVEVKEDVVTEECKVEGKYQKQGAPECTHVVKKEYKHDEENKLCTNFVCETIPAENCDKVFPKPTKTQCL